MSIQDCRILRDGRTLEDITPEIIAELFSRMKSDEQARFFSAVGECVGKWDRDFCFQLQWVAYDPALNAAGRTVMRQIGEYSEERST
jgi:hypothetical protein